jgi:hypothetical protein
MTIEFYLLVFLLFFLIAILYSSVGHAGASGYLAIMALLSFTPDTIKTTSLILNSVVAIIASIRFIKEGCFDRKIFIPFIITALPMSFLGGFITINPQYFKLAAGLFLIVSAILLMIKEYIITQNKPVRKMPWLWGLSIGAIIGLVSGLIGVGGGIFLSPIIIMANWTTAKNASGIAALFILCNSLAGLAGNMTALNTINFTIIYWIMAVLLGGLSGSYLGTIKFNHKVIITCLFLVLLSAGIKFIFT